jgi:ring-1,2-phenylacetyl-CoA epoxidase subunit PaaD
MVSEAPRRALPDREAVVATLDTIADPEIPAVSIVQLGMIGEVETGPGGIRVELLPTFVGCPALEIIRDTMMERLAVHGLPVEVAVSFRTPWTSDRISPEGRQALRRSGFAPPAHLAAAVGGGRALPVLDLAPAADDRPEEPTPCPYCGSTRTTLLSPFGPTQCRSIHHCADCRQPFEGFKAV